MTITVFPQTIFTTKKKFNDYSASDMQYGDISEDRLKKEFGLINVSNVVDPYTLTKLTAFDNPQSRYSGVYGSAHRGRSVSVQECARLLFEEMQVTSLPYSFVGAYKYLINKMLSHFQQSTGTSFYDMQLDMAYRNQIISDVSKNSTTEAIRKTINNLINYTRKGYPQDKLYMFDTAIRDTILPKFDSPLLDKINGLGVSVHDVHATKIDILSLDVGDKGWRAKVKFIGQDHFGLDINDICKMKFRQLQFFKIWFVLQRSNKFGFRPFLTNMEAVVNVEGGL